MKARLALSKGWPGELSTSCTIGGISVVGSIVAALRCSDSFFFAQDEQEPPPVCCPHAHFRCNIRPAVCGAAEPTPATVIAMRLLIPWSLRVFLLSPAAVLVWEPDAVAAPGRAFPI